MRAVLRRRPLREGRRAVLRPVVGIDQDAVRSIHALAHEKGRLTVEAGVAGEEVTFALLVRSAEAFVIEQCGQPLAEDATAGQLGKIGSGDAVLCIDPGSNLRIAANVVLQPAVGIGDRRAEMLVDDIDAFRFRVVHRSIFIQMLIRW